MIVTTSAVFVSNTTVLDIIIAEVITIVTVIVTVTLLVTVTVIVTVNKS